MPRFEIDVDPLDHITADAIGPPGQRVFYIQAWQDQRSRLHAQATGHFLMPKRDG